MNNKSYNQADIQRMGLYLRGIVGRGTAPLHIPPPPQRKRKKVKVKRGSSRSKGR